MTTDVRPAASDAGYEDLAPRERSARLLASLVRPAVGGVVLVVLYYLLPLDHALTVGTAIVFTVALAAFAVLMVMQVRHVTRSRYPRLRAITALAILIPNFLVLFAAAYYLIAVNNPAAFNELLNKTDSLYYTVTVFSTVGFGDIVPKTELARVITMMQMLGDLILIGMVGKVLLGAVSRGLERSRGGRSPGSGA